MKEKREYDVAAKIKCKLLGWRTDLMSTYIIGNPGTSSDHYGHVKEKQDLVYHPNPLRKVHTPVRII